MPAKNGKIVQCQTCNKDIYSCPSQNKKFCSRKCRAILQNPIRAQNVKNGQQIVCPTCKKTTYVCPSTLKLNKYGKKFCSIKCRAEAMKSQLTEWGFKKSDAKTYNNAYPRKQIKKIRLTEHRRVMQNHLGRKLLKDEHVHHINGNPKDNRLENLSILTPSDHDKLHRSSSL